MPRRRKSPESSPLDLREACVGAAREAIAERGIESLSLRDVARRLGVSHQAPYKHYASRDHLLAEVMRRCFQHFAAALDARPHHDDPHEDLHALGERYLSYASQHPLEYQLMFSTTWPEAAHDAELAEDATHAFDILRKVLRRMHGDSAAMRARVELDALYIWSMMHGLTGVLNGDCIGHLQLKRGVLRQAASYAMERMGVGLTGPR
jgi:AcrR family transcriptional regulator